ncbi:MAG: hypothetical protein Q9221_006227 [Calogaya cf. arnoldii]
MAQSEPGILQLSKTGKPKDERLSLFDFGYDDTDPYKKELEYFAKDRAYQLSQHNVDDLGGDPESRDDPVTTGLRLKYGNPHLFKDEFILEFKGWLARDTETRVLEALSTDDQYYFLKKAAKASLRQYVMWVFIREQWLRTPERPESYWRSKRFAEQDHETEIGFSVKANWDSR